MADFINQKVIERTVAMLRNLLDSYRHSIEMAYCRVDDGLTVGLSVKYKPKNSKIKIETGINFVSDRIKDQQMEVVDPNQLDLFPREPSSKLEDISIKLVEMPQREGYWKVKRSRRGLK